MLGDVPDFRAVIRQQLGALACGLERIEMSGPFWLSMVLKQGRFIYSGTFPENAEKTLFVNKQHARAKAAELLQCDLRVQSISIMTQVDVSIATYTRDDILSG